MWADSPHLGNLKSLNLMDNAIGDKGMVALCGAEALAGLRALNIEACGVTLTGLKALAVSPLNGLEQLNVSGNDLGCDGAEVLACGKNFSGLKTLQIWNSGLGDRGFTALAQSENLTALEELRLSGNSIGVLGYQAYDQATGLAALKTLDLRQNRFSPNSYLLFTESTWEETDFIREIARRTGCGLLLDINNVFVSATNHGYSAMSYLADFPLETVGEIHLAGHAEQGAGLREQRAQLGVGGRPAREHGHAAEAACLQHRRQQSARQSAGAQQVEDAHAAHGAARVQHARIGHEARRQRDARARVEQGGKEIGRALARRAAQALVAIGQVERAFGGAGHFHEAGQRLAHLQFRRAATLQQTSQLAQHGEATAALRASVGRDVGQCVGALGHAAAPRLRVVGPGRASQDRSKPCRPAPRGPPFPRGRQAFHPLDLVAVRP